MADEVTLTVEGMEIVERNMGAFGREIERLGELAGEEVAREVLDTMGVRKYPATTEANAPGRVRTVAFSDGSTAEFRVGYYIRGRGWMEPTRGGGYRQTGSSERYGTQFGSRPIQGGVEIYNRASYGPYLGGTDQLPALGAIGWRRLLDVAIEKVPKITTIYQRWINKMISDLGLK